MTTPMSPSRMLLTALLLTTPALSAFAEQPLALTAQTDGFAPAELQVPADQKLQIAVTNRTGAAIEFESFELNRERVIQSGQTVTIYLSPLGQGRYEFFDDFHPEHRGALVVK